MIKRVAIALMTVALVGWPGPVDAAAPRRAAPEVVLPKYALDVTLDFPSGNLRATETVRMVNARAEPLTEVVFNVTPARVAAIHIDAVTVDGQAVDPTIDGTLLSLELPEPLPPGGSTEIGLDFRETVPSPGDLRFGRSGSVIALGHWFPVLALYRPGQGWDRHRYVSIGDAFVTSVADFEVTLNLTGAADLIVAHPGARIARQGNQWRMRSERARDFALAVSSRYLTAASEVDGVAIKVYYLPEHAAGGAVYLQAAAESLRWYNQVLGSYPFGSLTVAETTGNDPGWVGQEFPGMVFMGSSTTASPGRMGEYLTYVVAHEVAHQWFYALVGNDQVYEPWLDEAFATYLGYQYLRTYYPGLYPTRWQAVKDRYADAASSSGWRSVDSSIYDFQSENIYYAMVYTQGALFLDELRVTLGDSSFWQLLRDFVARQRFQMATGRSFLVMAEQRAARDLDSIFARYFSPELYASDLDYAIPNGHFYSQANGQSPGRVDLGYSVTNFGRARFWDEFQRLGGVARVGYPASKRFVWDGFVSQVFQKGVLQWRPEAGQAYLVNVFDQMSAMGKDDWLNTVRSTPPISDWSDDEAQPWSDVVARHQQLLDSNPAIKSRYFAASNPLTFYGLPMAPIVDAGNAYVLRAQRAIIQQWKANTTWARAGEVTVANGGDIAKEAGMVSAAAVAPEDGIE